ncbi:Dabb family protein [Catenovulum adriaticum]|uniref:Dabb family protein n=1 Tax=Catenovulum adriaticum TaxID=2984846 RepID=A0ABY7AQE2_9ALTE|nr:Dabb family protein [Catenovulum sp. TS8]WAJ70466.1 Dabb family protein [Catenovulum sp. TS8]
MKKLCILLIAFMGLPFMASADQQKIEAGGFVHSVYFWLKNPDSDSERKEFEAHLTKFINASKYVKSKHIGTKASSHRDVVDSSYDYTLIVTFDDKAAQDKYQDEPVHHKFVEDASHLWRKVAVYDSHSIL